MGKAAREKVPRSSHGEWSPAAKRPDPIAVLEAQARTRVPELVPIRYGRMVESPFAFYRGAAAIMAADLAATPVSGFRVQLCGDAHLGNFGVFASPERRHVFDLNDFDETLPGPWEWDVKRLAASVAVAGRANGHSAAERAAAVRAASEGYRTGTRSLAEFGNLEVWYASTTIDEAVKSVHGTSSSSRLKRAEEAVAKAQDKDHLRALGKLTHRVKGELRFVSDPPLLVPVEEAFPGLTEREMQKRVAKFFDFFGGTLTRERRELLQTFRYAHLARKVVGVGSVGTRAYVALLLGRDDTDPLFLQIKEAEASVLEPYLGMAEEKYHGERVVHGQKMMQAFGDIFLGWHRNEDLDGIDRDYYVRQLWDSKGSILIDELAPDAMARFGRLCGQTLARAHARSGDQDAIGSYLGSGDAFDTAIAAFAEAYADQNERDHAALVDAVKTGRVEAKTGI